MMKRKLYNSFLLGILCALMLPMKGQLANQDWVNHQKYWYYKWRLNNHFVYVGGAQGQSIPFSERHYCSSDPWGGCDNLVVGDATLNLGWYIGLLATEFKLLKDQGQLFALEKTREELYYALRAFNGLDLNAERYWRMAVQGFPEGFAAPPLNSDLNGFFIRDDIPYDPASTIPNARAGCDGTGPFIIQSPLYHTNIPDWWDHFNSEKFPLIECPLDRVASDYAQGETSSDPNKGPIEQSHDQVIHMMMGLALVAKLVDANETFNNQPLNNQDLNPYFVQEAKNIVDRMISWERDHNWTIVNPVTGNCVESLNSTTFPCAPGNAANVQVNAYATAEAACKIQNGFGTGVSIIPGSWNTLPPSCSGYHGLFTLSNLVTESWLLYINLPECDVLQRTILGGPTELGKLYCRECRERSKAWFLAAIGNTLWDCVPTCAIPSSTLVNRTAEMLYNNTLGIRGESFQQVFFGLDYAQWEILPLVHDILYQGNGVGDQSDKDYYKKLLTTAPCGGTQNRPRGLGTDPIPFLWSANNSMMYPERRGMDESSDTDLRSCSDYFRGEYHGMDYMLLYNLLLIANGPGNGTFAGYTNLIDRKIELDFPFTPGGQGPPIGDDANPIKLEAFNSIKYDGEVDDEGNVTLRAGYEIVLEQGTLVAQGAVFETIIDPYACANDGSYQRLAEPCEGCEGYGMQGPGIPMDFNLSPLDYPQGQQLEDLSPEQQSLVRSMSEGMLGIAPNPTRDRTTVTLPEFSPGEIATLELIAPSGARLLKMQSDQGVFEVDLSNHPSAVYSINVMANEKRYFGRIVKH